MWPLKMIYEAAIALKPIDLRLKNARCGQGNSPRQIWFFILTRFILVRSKSNLNSVGFDSASETVGAGQDYRGVYLRNPS
jgi:hypothetical protein